MEPITFYGSMSVVCRIYQNCFLQDLREKNWKAMDALAEMEKNVNNKVKSAVQSVKVRIYVYSHL